MTTEEQQLQRAGEARQILESPIFQDARKDLESQLAQLRRQVPIGQTEMHTKLIMMEQVADRFFGYFEQLAYTGKLAQLHLEEQEQKKRSLAERILMFRTTGRGSL